MTFWRLCCWLLTLEWLPLYTHCPAEFDVRGRWGCVMAPAAGTLWCSSKADAILSHLLILALCVCKESFTWGTQSTLAPGLTPVTFSCVVSISSSFLPRSRMVAWLSAWALRDCWQGPLAMQRMSPLTPTLFWCVCRVQRPCGWGLLVGVWNWEGPVGERHPPLLLSPLLLLEESLSFEYQLSPKLLT